MSEIFRSMDYQAKLQKYKEVTGKLRSSKTYGGVISGANAKIDAALEEYGKLMKKYQEVITLKEMNVAGVDMIDVFKTMTTDIRLRSSNPNGHKQLREIAENLIIKVIDYLIHIRSRDLYMERTVLIFSKRLRAIFDTFFVTMPHVYADGVSWIRKGQETGWGLTLLDKLSVLVSIYPPYFIPDYINNTPKAPTIISSLVIHMITNVFDYLKNPKRKMKDQEVLEFQRFGVSDIIVKQKSALSTYLNEHPKVKGINVNQWIPTEDAKWFLYKFDRLVEDKLPHNDWQVLHNDIARAVGSPWIDIHNSQKMWIQDAEEFLITQKEEPEAFLTETHNNSIELVKMIDGSMRA